jgi:hypothetical protein
VWSLASHALAAPSTFVWEDGTELGSAIERPWLMLGDNVPAMLFGAARINTPTRGSGSFNVFIPLKGSETGAHEAPVIKSGK